MDFFKNANKMKFISLGVAAIGLILLLNSPRLASDAANSWARAMGGVVGTEEYLQVLKGYIDSYKLVGAIFLFTGLFSVLHQKNEK